MKKAILIPGALMISIMLTSTVYAGTLNAYEQEIISAARRAYEYEGVDYVVKQEYINELIAYLSSDDIDLNAEQKDKVMQEAFANVQRGVKEGYMIPLSPEDTEEEADSSENDQEDTNNNSSESNHSDAGSPSDDQTGTSAADKDNPNSSGKDDSDMSSPVTAIDKVLDDQDQKLTDSHEDQGGTKNSNTTIDTNIIKDTGFNLNPTIYTLIGMGVLMIAGMLVTLKYNFFAHKNE